MDCKQCKERFRADKLIEDYNDEHGIEIEGSVDGWSQEQMKQYIEDKHICCPSCGAHDLQISVSSTDVQDIPGCNRGC